MNYYNENDRNAAAWLRELIKRGHIAEGVVDERSIAQVLPADLAGFVQCHFFAGIGGWSYALRLAGWPDDATVWTGSCPCQPFSCAGKGRGTRDARHLWPEFRRLIEGGRPAIVFGEQVASAAGRAWLAGVCADLEALAYETAAADLCAAGVGAPHIRQRLYWMAEAGSTGCAQLRVSEPMETPCQAAERNGRCGDSGVAKTESEQFNRRPASAQPSRRPVPSDSRVLARLGNTDLARCARSGPPQSARWNGNLVAPWRESEILETWNENKQRWEARRVKPGLRLLADGIPGRVAQLRGFGNAIVPQVAAQFIQAAAESMTLNLEL